MKKPADVADTAPSAYARRQAEFGTGDARPGWNRWLLLLTALPVGALGLLGGPAMIAVLVGCVVWFVVSAVLFGRHLDYRRPRRPYRAVARMGRVRREPARQIPLYSRVCVICGRPLTNRESMRARVGSTCIKRYGPRFAFRVNPDHELWTLEMVRARADQAERQARLNVEFDRATAAYPGLVAAWEAERASETGRLRRDARRRAAPMFVSSIAACLASVVVPGFFG
ncbi:hypothetical protein EQW78_01605 [Oerskovia turbata]|uniref:Uncharacterized protein n=1 Tax=Oerskovia turbata TaxID=1713 RepID=A0A4Q1L183_9CELL|nr:DUF6011 domain-containing protein [Oerskovia turbata]RXR26358.1 hypothetical protein EQW73_08545 [Oerskovia turbata]RXR36533.1 hypothetical protein EQW78_01605 [Oerskovia turbata]TGJ97546.1 hypothetical protein DLJ96_06240 [Actinotalea fermentans ATCC 43279 = JCM 9966 = DSM 3133]